MNLGFYKAHSALLSAATRSTGSMTFAVLVTTECDGTEDAGGGGKESKGLDASHGRPPKARAILKNFANVFEDITSRSASYAAN